MIGRFLRPVPHPSPTPTGRGRRRGPTPTALLRGTLPHLYERCKVVVCVALLHRHRPAVLLSERCACANDVGSCTATVLFDGFRAEMEDLCVIMRDGAHICQPTNAAGGVFAALLRTTLGWCVASLADYLSSVHDALPLCFASRSSTLARASAHLEHDKCLRCSSTVWTARNTPVYMVILCLNNYVPVEQVWEREDREDEKAFLRFSASHGSWA